MQRVFFIVISVITLSIMLMCTAGKEIRSKLILHNTKLNDGHHDVEIHISNGQGFNHPTYVIWEEDYEGNYIRTIYITRSYASGSFGRQMLGDSMWLNTSGSSHQPAALPYWTHKKGLIDAKNLIPTPENPYVDAYSSATLQQNFTLTSKVGKENNKYKLLLEVNQSWDWNHFWTNNKYPESRAYKNSAQPSVIYAVSINNEQDQFFMNPIGHGDPKGESGKLFTDLSTLTSSRDIFREIRIEIRKNNSTKRS
jgi:hypothetical protein